MIARKKVVILLEYTVERQHFLLFLALSGSASLIWDWMQMPRISRQRRQRVAQNVNKPMFECFKGGLWPAKHCLFVPGLDSVDACVCSRCRCDPGRKFHFCRPAEEGQLHLPAVLRPLHMPGSGSGTCGLHCRDWCSQLGAAVKNHWILHQIFWFCQLHSSYVDFFDVMHPATQDGDTALQITQRRRDPADVVAVTKVWIVSVDVTFWSVESCRFMLIHVDSCWFMLIGIDMYWLDCLKTWSRTFYLMGSWAQMSLLDSELYLTYFTSLWGVESTVFFPTFSKAKGGSVKALGHMMVSVLEALH